jgi:NAD(P)H-hydrate epimerase
MIPVVTPEEMAAIDRAAPEPVDVLIGRAGGAVARAARRMLGGSYGRRVVVLAGKGNNGNDGREAARRLRAWGARVVVLDAADRPTTVPACDLVIDAAYGTGFRGEHVPPEVPEDVPVLAVDIPSGVDGLTGEVGGRALRAARTVTFAAGKPGLYLGAGPDLAGSVEVVDIGLDVSSASIHVVEPADAIGWLPPLASDTHKWKRAVCVVAGSPGMSGAAALVCAGAQRAGAGYVRLSAPGGLGAAATTIPIEVVHVDLPTEDFAETLMADLDRFRSLIIGNGLGSADERTASIRAAVAAARDRDLTTVIDADGVTALAAKGAVAADRCGPRTILTPHDGEFARLAGGPPGADRLADTRHLAARLGAVVLLKGPTTIVARPDGAVLLSTSGVPQLATAGTGDVLAGIIGAFAAEGLAPAEAAAAGASVHGAAAALGWRRGLVAGDVAALLPALLDR